MNIAIVMPPSPRGPGMIMSPALDIAYLVAIFKREHAFKLYDLRLHCLKQDGHYKKMGVNLDVYADKTRCLKHLKNPDQTLEAYDQKILEEISYKNMDVVILSISVCQQLALQYLLPALCLAQRMKKDSPDKKIILTGNCPLKHAKVIIDAFEFIDAIIFEGNEGALGDYLNNGDSHIPIPGICYRNGIQVISCDEKRRTDINDLPTPDFDLYDLAAYRVNGKLVLPYEISRGCIKNCFFCYYIHKNSIQYKNVQKVTADLKYLVDKYGTYLFHFVDAEINFSSDYLSQLTPAFKESLPEIKWSALAIPNMSRSQIINLKEAGCVQLRWGVEYFSPTMLRRIRKDTTTKSIVESIQNAHLLGINNYLTCITGLPGETERNILETKAFIRKYAYAIDSLMECPYGELGQFSLKELTQNTGAPPSGNRLRQYQGICSRMGIKDKDIIAFLTER